MASAKSIFGFGSAQGANINDNYKLGKELGRGTFSVVREATRNSDGKRFAVKCINRKGLTKEDEEALVAEVEILRTIDHPNILNLLDVYSEESSYYLVTELLEGGELFDRIIEKEYYPEKEARDLVKLLLEAMAYCHSKNIAHRDLKPENLLLTSKTDDASIKIGDFGFAKAYSGGSELQTACGTPGYVAPEILEGKPYDSKVDVWSIGIITYTLLCGYPPFHDDVHTKLFQMIKKGEFEFDSPYWDEVSQSPRDFISKMLITDPSKRPTCDELLTDSWIIGEDTPMQHLDSAISKFREFHARRKFKAAVKTVQMVRQTASMAGLTLKSVTPQAQEQAQFTNEEGVGVVAGDDNTATDETDGAGLM